MHVGRGGWTWYTGSAGWMYQAAIEALLGLRRHGDTFSINPCIPAMWPDLRDRVDDRPDALPHPCQQSRAPLRRRRDRRQLTASLPMPAPFRSWRMGRRISSRSSWAACSRSTSVRRRRARWRAGGRPAGLDRHRAMLYACVGTTDRDIPIDSDEISQAAPSALTHPGPGRRRAGAVRMGRARRRPLGRGPARVCRGTGPGRNAGIAGGAQLGRVVAR